jgi:hypothetical protein
MENLHETLDFSPKKQPLVTKHDNRKSNIYRSVAEARDAGRNDFLPMVV